MTAPMSEQRLDVIRDRRFVEEGRHLFRRFVDDLERALFQQGALAHNDRCALIAEVDRLRADQAQILDIIARWMEDDAVVPGLCTRLIEAGFEVPDVAELAAKEA